MSEATVMDRARQIAGQCWCDEGTSSIEVDVRLGESFASRLAAWIARAEAAEADARRYRKALVKIRDARIRDGSAADVCKAIAESELAKEAK